MNIFNRNKNLDDDLPGREAMPRPTLPRIEDEIADQFAKRPTLRTPAALAVELEANASSFEMAVNDAEEAAKAYCATYAELEVEISSKLEAIEAQRKELRKLQASLPRVEKPNEQDEEHPVTHPDGGVDIKPRDGKNPVPIRPIGEGKSLPLNRR